jgi:hypothetical protein
MNPRMGLAITIAVLSVLAGASAQLDPLIGVAAAKATTSLCTLVTAMLAAAVGVLSTQGSQNSAMAANPAALAETIKQMPGVEGLTVNKFASPELAALAMSPENNKISAKPGQETQLEQVAKSVG